MTTVSTIRKLTVFYTTKIMVYRSKLNYQLEVIPISDEACEDYLSEFLLVSKTELLFHLHRHSFPLCFRQIATKTNNYCF